MMLLAALVCCTAFREVRPFSDVPTGEPTCNMNGIVAAHNGIIQCECDKRG